MFRRLRNKRLYKKSLNAPSVYAVIIQYNWHYRTYKFAGEWEWDERCKEWVPLVYQNIMGDWELKKITDTTTGGMIGWTFNRARADAWVYEKKILEEVNYGGVFNK